MPVIGFLHQGSAGANVKVIDAFRHGMQEAGYEEGWNAHVEFRWADGHYERLRTLAAELVRLRPAVITAALLPAAQAAKGGHHDHSDRFYQRLRPDRERPCRKPRPTDRQRDWRQPVLGSADLKKTGAAA
jgi:hypothetical protein